MAEAYVPQVYVHKRLRRYNRQVALTFGGFQHGHRQWSTAPQVQSVSSYFGFLYLRKHEPDEVKNVYQWTLAIDNAQVTSIPEAKGDVTGCDEYHSRPIKPVHPEESPPN